MFLAHMRHTQIHKTTSAKDKAVRFRSVQLIASVLNTMTADAEISEELFESVTHTMMVRIQDKVPIVRVFAIHAMTRLQGEEVGRAEREKRSRFRHF